MRTQNHFFEKKVVEFFTKFLLRADLCSNCGCFLLHRENYFSKNDLEVSGSARGASPTYPGPYLTRFDGNRLKHSYYKKIPIKIA